jgi:undecaprenyl diphosphate synthase
METEDGQWLGGWREKRVSLWNQPGFQLYELCSDLGVKELTLYGFTVAIPSGRQSEGGVSEGLCRCSDGIDETGRRASGDWEHRLTVLSQRVDPLYKRVKFGEGKIKVNFLVNYGWTGSQP